VSAPGKTAIADRDPKPSNVTVTVRRQVVEDSAGYEAFVQLVSSMLDARRRSGAR
jgi:hypothetical protein